MQSSRNSYLDVLLVVADVVILVVRYVSYQNRLPLTNLTVVWLIRFEQFTQSFGSIFNLDREKTCTFAIKFVLFFFLTRAQTCLVGTRSMR